MRRRLAFPPRGRLSPTGPVDVVDDYYRFPISWFLRRRFVWASHALGDRQWGTILEIGYGSGVFLYELARHAEQILGIDRHGQHGAVAERLRRDGIRARLIEAAGESLPLRNGSVDAIVMVSVLEFVTDPGACLAEAVRVLRPGGRLVLIRPRALRWADAAWKVATHRDPEVEFQGARVEVAAALAQRLPGASYRHMPIGVPAILAPFDRIVYTKPAYEPLGLNPDSEKKD